MSGDPVIVVSVYINRFMYRNYFENNSSLLQSNLDCVDNRILNRGLPAIYNEKINKYLKDDVWIYFVHEDFEIKDPLDEAVEDLNPNSIYGTFGVKLVGDFPVAYGKHLCSNKDGSNCVEAGLNIDFPEKVDAIDCQSILIHTSLLRRHNNLRFDEKLTFDLYAEDLCLNSKFELDIGIFVFPLKFQHYSHGKISKRYMDGLDYLAGKYPNFAIPGTCSFIGGGAKKLEEKFKYNIEASS
jgi:hypothetical protein